MAGMLEGKVALVTGAGHGIGRSHALELASHGAKVVVNDLGGSASGEGDGKVAEEVCEIIKQKGGEAIPDFGDVGDEAQAEAMIKRGIDEWGRFDVLVNNAGIVRDRAIWNMTVEDFDLVTRVHLRGTWLTCRAAARYWRAIAKDTGSKNIGGRIINTISGAGLLGHFGQSNYATAKSAVAGLTLTLSLELASIGVTVNAIGPGALTRLSATIPGAPKPREANEYADDEWDDKGPFISSPVVAWMASDDSHYMSGQVIKALGENIQWMQTWTEKKQINNGGKRWQAEDLARMMGTDLFGVKAPGLRLGG